MSKAICTIVASNYLPQAEVLFASIRSTNPDFKLFCLLIDYTDDIALPDVTIINPQEINVQKALLDELILKYDVVEFATAMKPYLLKFLTLSNSFSEIVYLDPDICVFSKMDDHFPVNQSDFCAVLTPHRLSQTALDKGIFYDIELLKTGYFNLGFISINSSHGQTIPFLNWWISRVNHFASRLGFLPFFTDQKWIDLAFHLFPMRLCKHLGYNVAPWNIDEREITLQQTTLLAGSQPVVFIHFSQLSESLKLGIALDYWGKASDSPLSEDFQTLLTDWVVNPYIRLLKEAASHHKLLQLSGEFNSWSKNYPRNVVWKSYINRTFLSGNLPKSWTLKLFSSNLMNVLSRSYGISMSWLGFRKDFLRIKKKLKGSKHLDIESLFLP